MRNTSLPSFSLSREDLEHVVELFADVGHVEISDDDHEFDNLNEAYGTLGDKPRLLQIKIAEPELNYRLENGRVFPDVSLELNRRGGTRLDYWSGYDSKGRPGERLYLSLEKFLGERRTFAARPFGILIIVLAAVLFTGSGFLIPLVATLAKFPHGEISATALLACICLLEVTALCVYVRRRGYALVSLTPRADRTNFWKRNRDKLYLLALGTALGVILKALQEWLTGKK